MGFYMDRLEREPIRISSELLEPVFAEVIGSYWEEMEDEGLTEDVEALEMLKKRLMVLGRVAATANATHCNIAMSNHCGDIERLIRIKKGEWK